MEIYEDQDGKVRFYIAYSDKNLSTGILILEPHIELPKHNRPYLEQLIQVYGTCIIKLFDENEVEEKTLKEKDSLEIPANKYHIHLNPTGEKSITMWKVEGDITPIIEKIRKTYKKI